MNGHKYALTKRTTLPLVRKVFAIWMAFSFVFSPVSIALAQSDSASAQAIPPVSTTGGNSTNSSPPDASGSSGQTDSFTISGVDSSPSPTNNTTQAPPPDSNTPNTDTSAADTAAATNQVDGASQNPGSNQPVSAASIKDPIAKTAFAPATPSGIASNKWLNSYGDRLYLPQPSEVSGAFTQNIPIVTPPGRDGVQPDLKISYNSQDKSNDNIFGFGWSINIPYIQRINKDGINNIYNEYHFSSTLDGELATTSSSAPTTQYGARFDDGSFRQYTFSTSSQTWTMIDKSGTKYIFGSSTASRVYNSGTSSPDVYRWMLASVQDTNGNVMTYNYAQDQGQIYPSIIQYTSNGTTSAAFEVDFVTEARSDTNVSDESGFQVITAKRVKEIDIKFNGNIVHKYALAYATGNNGVRSLLQSVTETGYDESGTGTTLPALSFSYQTQDATWPGTVPSPFTLPDLTDPNGKDWGWRVLQIISNDGNAFALSVASNTPVAYDWSNSWSNISAQVNNMPALVDSSRLDIGVGFADVDGDGFVDIIRGRQNSYHDVWLRPFLVGTTSMSNIPDILDTTGNDLGVRFGDFNGDGYPDYLIANTSGTAVYFSKANGTGWQAGASTSVSFSFVDASGNDNGARVLDVNGDGVDDVIKYLSGDTGPTVYLNSGDGVHWSVVTSGLSGIPLIAGTSGADIGTRITDIDGDGLPDFIVSTPARGIHFYVNKGDGKTFTDTSYATGTIPFFLDASSTDIGTRIIMANSDGIPDFVEGGFWFKSNYFSSGHPVDVLNTVTLPTGGTISVTYNGMQINGGILQTVKSITNDPGLGGTPIITNYDFQGGEYQTIYQDRKFAGFFQISTHDSQNNYTVTYYHQGDGNQNFSALKGEYNDIEAKMYHPYRTDTFFGTGTLLKTEITKWDSKDLGNGRTFVFPADKLTLSKDGLSTHRDTAVAYDYSTTTGNVLSKTEYGEVSGNDDGTFTDLTNIDNRITTFSYATSSSTSTNSTLSLPAEQLLSDYLGTKVSDVKTYYDGLSFGMATTGNATRQEFFKSGSSYASTTKSYNAFGLVNKTTDGRGATTTLSYDTFNLYPSTSTNALGQVTGTLYDYTSGKTKQTTDVNGLVYQTVFDGLDRPLTEKEPDLTTPSTLDTKNSYTYTDTALAVSVQKTSFLNGATSTNLYTYYDGMNRPIQVRASAQGTNNYAVTDSIYDFRGSLQRQSLPYFSSGSSKTSATTSSALFKTFTYDTLLRPIYVNDALGTTTNAYANWKTTTTDKDGKIKDAINDGFGNLTNIVEHISTSTATTTYAWDQNNNLLSITDSMGNVRNFTYDGLSRQLTAQDLHASGDGTFGTWTYTYDDANNLTQQVDPKSQTVNYTYDALNRPSTEDFTGGSGTEVTYTYDTCTNGKGKLCTASTTDALTSLTYNANGAVASESKTIGGTGYTTSYSYDRQGNTTDITYPDSTAVKYLYDDTGFLSSILRKATSTYATALSQIQYGPTGAITSKQFGNGVTSAYTFDANQLYRLTHILTTASSTIVGGGGVGGSLGLRADPFANLASAQKGSSLASAAVPEDSILYDKAGAFDLSVGKLLDEPLGNTFAVANSKIDSSQPAVTVINPTAPTTPPTQIETNTGLVSFANTDDNTGENLIISSDQQVYSGVAQADVYFSVKNTSKSVQNVDLSFYLPDTDTQSVSDITRLSVQSKSVPTYSKTCTTEAIASTTPGLTMCNHAKTGTENVTYVSSAAPLAASAYDSSGVIAMVASGGVTQKSVRGDTGSATAFDTLQPGETGYYKATLHYPRNASGEFYIEAVGDNGGYGQLDPWFSSSWQYRKAIVLSGSSGAGTNYQVLLRIGESSGSTSTKQFDLGGHSSVFPTGQNQGGDLYFTASDGVTPLSFWVEDATGTAPNRIAYVWVKVSDDLGSAKTIYVYYGNSGASNASNGSNTFNFFDNFDGTGIDGSKWTTMCATGCNITGGSTTNISESGGTLNQSDAAVANSRSRAVATSTPFGTSGFAIKRRFKTTTTGTFASTNLGFASGVTAYNDEATTSPILQGLNFTSNWVYQVTNAPASKQIYTPGPVQGVWYREESQRISPSQAAVTLWSDAQSPLGASSTVANPSVSDTEYPELWSGDGFSAATDWVLVRKYVSPEPAFSSTGSEETFSGSGAGSIQDISYTYDAVGNITNMYDYSGTNAAKTVNFTYDDLYRLLTASTTAASSTSYSQTYAYNNIGDLTSKSDVGSYLYAGTGNANPHAPTSVNGSTYTYDNNGNLTNGGGETYAWDYRNRMTSAGNGTATTTFAYDFQNQRVKKTQGANTTIYPNKYVTIAGATTTDYIYLGDSIIAEVESGTGSGGGGGSTSTSTPALLQSAIAHGATSVTFANAVTASSTVIVGITVFSQTLAANQITDNKGNTYIKAAEAINGGTDHAAIYYASNVKGGAGFQVSSGAVDGTIAIHEYSGVSLTSAFVASSTLTGSASTNPHTNAAAATVGNSLFFSVAWSSNSGDTWSTPTGSGYTLRQNETDDNTFERLATEDATTSAASTSVAWYSVPTSSSYAAALAIFKPLVTTTGGSGGTGGGSATTTRYFHEDHLNSTNVVTDYRGNVVQTLDYYPYGGVRINVSTGSNNELKRYIGQLQDLEDQLSYLNARYYDLTRGQFLSEDPQFWSKPDLTDPQSLNSYSYSRDNPMRYSDPSGMTIADQIATIQKEIALLQQAINLQKQIIALTSGVETYSNGVQQGIFNPAQATQNIQTSGVSTPQTAGNAVGLTALGVMTIGPAIAAAAAAPAAPVAAVPLADAEPIGSALKADPYHIAPTFMKETADQLGKKFLITGADEEDYILTQVEGGLDTGKGMIKGIYEYIQDGAGQITHQIFKPGGIINGTPN